MPAKLPAKLPAAPSSVGALASRYASMHDALAPYLAAHETPEPLLFAFQDDPAAREVQDEYLLGPGVLVAPALDQNTSRLVYLPAGEWRNVFTGEKFTGPRTIVAATPPDTIPVYALSDCRPAEPCSSRKARYPAGPINTPSNPARALSSSRRPAACISSSRRSINERT